MSYANGIEVSPTPFVLSQWGGKLQISLTMDCGKPRTFVNLLTYMRSTDRNITMQITCNYVFYSPKFKSLSTAIKETI